MASRIKGITVEIGGDVTELDKALKGVNSNISETQKKLKDVERLLKLDPTNVELLDQKQRLLAQSAEQTAEKYKTLKDTLDKSTASNVLFDKWEKSMAAFQGQITKTEKSLSDLNAEQKRLEGLGFGPDSAEMADVQNRIDVTTEKLEKLQAQVRDTYEAMGRPISIDQYDALQRELVEAGDAAENAEKAFENFNTTAARIGGAADGIAEKAGALEQAFAPISKAAGVALGAMFATVPATEDFRSALSKLETNAQQAGVGMEFLEGALTELNRISDDTDSSVEALSNLLMAGATESNLQRAVENLAGAATAFPDTIKIESLADSLQETLATGEATGQFAEMLDRLGVGTETFNAQLSQVPGEANKLNFALDTLANEGMADVYNAWLSNNEALVDNKDANMDLMQSLSDLADALTPIVTTVTSFAAKEIDWFAGLSPASQAAILSILGVTAAISPIAGMISNIGGAISTVSKVAGIFAGGIGDKVYLTFAKWALIITAVVLAVATLIALINVLVGKGDQVSGVLKSVGSTISSGTSAAMPTSGAAMAMETGLPAFASGGVFMPNNPVLGIFGDNTRETEIAAPESALKSTFLDALDSRGVGAAGKTVVNINYTGSLAQLARIMQPQISIEAARRGPSLTNI